MMCVLGLFCYNKRSILLSPRSSCGLLLLKRLAGKFQQAEGRAAPPNVRYREIQLPTDGKTDASASTARANKNISYAHNIVHRSTVVVYHQISERGHKPHQRRSDERQPGARRLHPLRRQVTHRELRYYCGGVRPAGTAFPDGLEKLKKKRMETLLYYTVERHK